MTASHLTALVLVPATGAALVYAMTLYVMGRNGRRVARWTALAAWVALLVTGLVVLPA